MTLHARLSRSVIATAVGALVAVASGSAMAATGGGWPPTEPHYVDATATVATIHTAVPGGATGYAVVTPACDTAVVPGHVNCFAMKRVAVPKGTPDARAYRKPFGGRTSQTSQRLGHSLTIGPGPADGYTPDDLASVYGFNPDAKRKSQLVAIVDWFNDPRIKSDLAQFDREYGLRKETASSLRVLNQNGKASPLPSSKKGKSTSFEISLDVETVRGVCHTCRILLLEANDSSNQATAKAENTAARLGATEVSNSFGGPESFYTAKQRAAYNHPGVVITASTGDDGWFAWDQANATGGGSTNQTNFPSTAAGVVSVGGTSLQIGQAGDRVSEVVWNENGPDDQVGIGVPDAGTLKAGPEGATGGGCSARIKAPRWQAAFPGYSAAGCNGHRLAADVSADADPYFGGLDVYDTWESGPHWSTAGGTSLASPIIAAMYALAGGSGQAEYPAFSLYVNAQLHAFDVTSQDLGGGASSGGNGFCGGDNTLNCGNDAYSYSSGNTHNPNALGAGNLDCSFPRNTHEVATAPAESSECNAVAGYDGPSGVGTPLSDALFSPTSPVAAIHHPAVVRLRRAATFTATAAPRLSGAHITSLVFSWGDGHSSTGLSRTQSHTFRKNGAYRVRLTVTDSSGQRSVATTIVRIGQPLRLSLRGPRSLQHGHTGRFHATATDPNTGGHITSIRWNWGDHKLSKGPSPRHTWRQAGHYIITIRLKDSTGVATTYTARQTVT
jgi:PKD repeat protein